MFGISGSELLIVAVFAFLIFGPDKIPEIARTVSKTVNMFKRTQEDMEKMIKAEMMGFDLDKSDSVFGLGDKTASAATSEATVTPKKTPSTASSLYGIDDEEEDEE